MCDSCTPVLDGEMLSLRFAEAVKHENYNFNVFITLPGQDIDECLLMSHLGQSCSLKLKHKSNWNYVKIESTWKWKYDWEKLSKLNL